MQQQFHDHIERVWDLFLLTLALIVVLGVACGIQYFINPQEGAVRAYALGPFFSALWKAIGVSLFAATIYWWRKTRANDTLDQERLFKITTVWWFITVILFIISSILDYVHGDMYATMLMNTICAAGAILSLAYVVFLGGSYAAMRGATSAAAAHTARAMFGGWRRLIGLLVIGFIIWFMMSSWPQKFRADLINRVKAEQEARAKENQPTAPTPAPIPTPEDDGLTSDTAAAPANKNSLDGTGPFQKWEKGKGTTPIAPQGGGDDGLTSDTGSDTGTFGK